MVTIASEPEAPQTTKQEIAERASALRDDAVRASRTLLTGDARGRARRNLLFVVALLGYVLPALGPLGLTALLLLALTDLVVVD